MMATRMPARARRCAREGPDWPVPMMIASYAFISILLAGRRHERPAFYSPPSSHPLSHTSAFASGNTGAPVAAFTPAGIRAWMAEKIGLAGFSGHCVTHGLRKAAARRLAEAGLTTPKIMAITGHKSLQEVERYPRETGQERSAQAAFRKLES